MYKDFQELFERVFKEFIEDNGSTVEKFYKELRDSVDENPEDNLFLQVVLASTDFDVFMQLMTDVAKEEQSKKDTEGGGSKRGEVEDFSSPSKYGDEDDDGDFI